MPDLSTIRHERERQFAAAFFDHDEWEYEPGPYLLSDGRKYTPDFLDRKRNTIIEVVGSRQAFHFNLDKYKAFKQSHENFEVRHFETHKCMDFLRPNLFTRKKDFSYRTGVPSALSKRLEDSSMFYDEIVYILFVERCTVCDLAEAIGVSSQDISLIVTKCRYRWVRETTTYLIERFLSLWRKGQIGFQMTPSVNSKVTQTKVIRCLKS